MANGNGRVGLKERLAQAGDLHRQQVVTGGDAGAAHGDHFVGRCAGKRLQVHGAQCLGRPEAAIAAEVVLQRDIDRTRDMAGHRVDGFGRAAGTDDDVPVGQVASRRLDSGWPGGRVGLADGPGEGRRGPTPVRRAAPRPVAVVW